jgi:ABC-2 type transport system permease protein
VSADVWRPYLAGFATRFLAMLQYRAAALAGFGTQCWWGAIKIMVYAAFFEAGARRGGAFTLADAITYTWLAQALLALQPWSVDPEIAAAVRTGGVGYDRIRPVDAFGWWFVRAAGWMTSRCVPRAALMFAVAGVALPLAGFGRWAWGPPASPAAAALFVLSLALAVALSSTMTVLLDLIVAATLNDRGANVLVSPLTILLSGNLLPLMLFPGWARTALFVQPFAGVLDIPLRMYFGLLSGTAAAAGLGLQLFWTLALAGLGRWWMARLMRRLQVQGG